MTKKIENIILLGSSGHALVALDICMFNKLNLIGYLSSKKSVVFPNEIAYLGLEPEEIVQNNLDSAFFVAIGDNIIRRNLIEKLISLNCKLLNLIHPSAIISRSVVLNDSILISAGVIINSLASIGQGVILNTNSTIEHECIVGNFSHIAPGATLLGNVTIGEGSFVGANAVIKQGINIGRNVIIGAGSVVLKDVPDNSSIAGNPAKKI